MYSKAIIWNPLDLPEAVVETRLKHIFIRYANKNLEFPGSKRNLLLRLPADLPMDLDPLAGDHLAAVTEVEVNLF